MHPVKLIRGMSKLLGTSDENPNSRLLLTNDWDKSNNHLTEPGNGTLCLTVAFAATRP